MGANQTTKIEKLAIHIDSARLSRWRWRKVLIISGNCIVGHIFRIMVAQDRSRSDT